MYRKKGIRPSRKETVEEYLIQWLPTGKVRGKPLRPETIRARHLNINRMSKYIGLIKLTKLKAADIRGMLDDLNEKGILADNSRRQLYEVLNAALNDAVNKDPKRIEYNPMISIDNLLLTTRQRTHYLEMK